MKVLVEVTGNEKLAYYELRRRVRAAGVNWERNGYQELVRMLDTKALELVEALKESDRSRPVDLFELLRHVSGLKIPPDQLKAAAGFLADLAEARYAFQ